MQLLRYLPLLLLTTITLTARANEISFTEALQSALHHNPRISASQAKIDFANGSIIKSRGEGLPTLSVDVNATHSNNPLTVFGSKLSQGNASFADFGANLYTGPASVGVKPAALNSPGYYNNWNTGVVMTIPLFHGGASFAKTRRAELLMKAAQHGDQNARTQLTYDVLQYYNGVHVTKDLVRIAKQSLAMADEFIRLTRDLSKQSITIKSDVLMAENYRRSVEATLNAAVAEEKNQLDAFRDLIGQPDSALYPGKWAELVFSKKSVDQLQSQARLSNAQLQALKSTVDAERQSIKAARAQYWPQLDLQLRHDWNAYHPSLTGSSNTAMLVLNWNILTFGSQYGAAKEAYAQYNTADSALHDAANNIDLAIRETIRAMDTARVQYELSKQSTAQGQTIVKDMELRYGQGIIPLGQLLDSQSRLDTARAQQILAKYNLLLAKARLLSLINQLHPEQASV